MPNEGEQLVTFDAGVLASTAATSPLTGTLDVPDGFMATPTESTGILERVGVLELCGIIETLMFKARQTSERLIGLAVQQRAAKCS